MKAHRHRVLALNYTSQTRDLKDEVEPQRVLKASSIVKKTRAKSEPRKAPTLSLTSSVTVCSEIASAAPLLASLQNRSISGTSPTVETVTLLAFKRTPARGSVKIFTARITLPGKLKNGPHIAVIRA